MTTRGLGIDRYGAGLADRLARQRVGADQGFPPPGKSQDFTLAQSVRKDLAVNGWTIRTIAITNLTPFFIHFPNNPAALQWVLPNTLGATIPVFDDPVRINSIDVPAGILIPTTSTQLASITALEEPLPYSPGIPFSAAPNISPNKRPLGFQTVAGANTGLISGIANQTIYIFDISLGNDAIVGAGASQFLDGSGGVPIAIFSTASLNPAAFDAHGAPLTAGNGLFVTVPAGAAIRGTVSYSQA